MTGDTDRSDQSETASDHDSEGNEEQGGPSGSNAVLRPKRGAFPTPQSKIEEARPYVPENDETD